MTPTPPARPGFAFPGRLLVFLAFMTQFVVLLIGLGGVVPYYHDRGVGLVLLVPGAIAGFVLLQAALSLLLRLLPARCTGCGGRSRFAGFGWWPFIYCFDCGACGVRRRIEIGGR